MYSFLVLGLVPGTNIQINFAGWLAAFGIVVGVVILINLRLRQRIVPVERAVNRVLLHATQLHQRAK